MRVFQDQYHHETGNGFTSDLLDYVDNISKETPELRRGYSSLTYEQANLIKNLRKEKCSSDEVYDSEVEMCFKAVIQIEIRRESNGLRDSEERYFHIISGGRKIGDAVCEFRSLPEHDEPYAYISVLSIDNRFQGQGLAGRLMDDVIKNCSTPQTGKKIQHLSLKVDGQNFPAIKLYHSKGFQIIPGTELNFEMRYQPTQY